MSVEHREPKELLPDIVNYSFIEEGLYLGNLTAALDINTLKQLRISHILTIDSKPLPACIQNINGLHTYYVEVNDMSSEDLLRHFPEIVKFIIDGQTKGNVLVHCYFGVSRSASSVIAFLMWKYDLSLDEAISRVKLKRKCISPNNGFMSQLLLYRRLNFNLSESSNSYKLYLLNMAGNAFKKGQFKFEEITKIASDNSVISEGESVIVKCKNCRISLLNDRSIIEHNRGESPKWHSPAGSGKTNVNCLMGIFATPQEWMEVEGRPQGKLHCPNCKHKIGSFNWIKGYECACKAVIAPGFFVVPSKVDLNRRHDLIAT